MDTAPPNDSSLNYTLHIINATKKNLYVKVGRGLNQSGGPADATMVVASHSQTEMKKFQPEINEMFEINDGYYIVFSTPYALVEIRRLLDTDQIDCISSTDEAKKVKILVLIEAENTPDLKLVN